jgi:hypothetical protein
MTVTDLGRKSFYLRKTLMTLQITGEKKRLKLYPERLAVLHQKNTVTWTKQNDALGLSQGRLGIV